MPMEMSLMLAWVPNHLTLGGALCKVLRWLEEAHNGEWEMGG